MTTTPTYLNIKKVCGGVSSHLIKIFLCTVLLCTQTFATPTYTVSSTSVAARLMGVRQDQTILLARNDSRPRGAKAYDQHMLSMLAKYGGVCYPLRDQALTTGAGAGVVQSLRGDYPGAVSGVTYYNQVVVTGTLNPDAAGTYTAVGMYNGYPIYRRGSDNWWVRQNSTATQYVVCQTSSGSVSGEAWIRGAHVLIGAYSVYNGATGTATVANVPASGVYLFTPSGVTLQSAGPPLAGEIVKAAGFDGSNGYLSVPQAISTACDGKDLTVCAWVNMAVENMSNAGIFGLGLTGNRQAWLFVNSKTPAFHRKFSSVQAQMVAANALTVGWHNICGICANKKNYLYVDGVLVSAGGQDGSGNYITGDSTNHIGLISGFNKLNGSLAYATISPAAWSAADVLQTYLVGRNGI